MKKIKKPGLIISIISFSALSLLIFNNIFQSIIFLAQYKNFGFIILALSVIFALIYSIIENIDG